MAKHLTASDLRRNLMRSALRELAEEKFGTSVGMRDNILRLPRKDQANLYGKARAMAQESAR